ncbi:MAG: SusC/RagA family protein [Bacteroidetes bacterium HGW-Bacteroidetes-4]|jgi:iron complex outermembrane receptor protein|nr:MAG: SusC/RagA family protein [Bacteroidetes bacterium HGW-Bacteroidetes-4]
MVRKILLILTVFLATSAMVLAQSGSVKGKIVDGKGLPLIGANVVIKGTTTGTITDIDGNYLIPKINAGQQTLVASFIGFAAQEVMVTIQNGQTATVNFTLIEDIATLDELVVIGYGTVKKEDATGSVVALNSDDFNKGPIATPDQLITGKVAGVQITSAGGAPGSGQTIRIRGGASLNASNDPLIVIDGIPTDNDGISGLANPLASINPNDIESMTILKDASATAIYGSRASNGVIIITTKKGKVGQALKIDYQGSVSIYQNTKKVDVLNGTEFIDAVTNYAGTFSNPSLITQHLGTESTNWQDEIFQSAVGTDHNLSVSGALANVPYRVSGGYFSQEGTLKTGKLDRMSFNASVNPSFFDDYLKLNLNAKGSATNSKFADEGAIGAAIQMDPTKPVYNTDGSFFTWLNDDGTIKGQATRNPVAMLELRDDVSEVSRFSGNAQLDYKFHFLPELRANLNLGIDKSNSEGTITVDTAASWQKNGDLAGYYSEYTQEKENKLLDFYLQYTKEVESIDLNFDVQGGYSYQAFYRSSSNYSKYATRAGVATETDTIVPYDLFQTENYLLSYFGRTNLKFKDRYMLTVTLRNDYSSRFSPENRSGFFPSVAFAWNITKESFMDNATFVNNLKLRAGWGITGQQAITSTDYPYQPNYYLSTPTASYQFGNTFYRGYRPDRYDENIKWEETSTLNMGFEFGFLNDRFTGLIDFYSKKSVDLINEVPVPGGTNFSNRLVTNVGDLTNKGVEFNLVSRIISTTDLFWEVGFNCTYNKNEITRLTEFSNPDYLGVPTGGIAGGVGNNIQIHSVGHSANSFLVYQQIYDETGKPIEGLYTDFSNDGEFNDKDKYIYKDPHPNFYFGINSAFSYKDLTFSFSGRAQFNNYVYNNVSSNNGELSRLYRPEGPYIANITRDGLDVNFRIPQYWSDYYISNGTFFRMDNIMLSYEFKELAGSKVNLGLSASVNNAFVITKYKGLDPEVNNGIDNNIYPRPRVYMFGVNFKF